MTCKLSQPGPEVMQPYSETQLIHSSPVCCFLSHYSLLHVRKTDPCVSPIDIFLTRHKTDMGQGGAMAIEDAVSIGTLLPLGTTKEEIPARLRLYEKARRERIEMVLDYTRMNGRDENDISQGARITREYYFSFPYFFFCHILSREPKTLTL